MAFAAPAVLNDPGFQLSFAATLGLVLYGEPLTRWFVRLASRWLPSAQAEKLGGPVSEFFLLTLAAQLTTLPVIIYHFQRVSISSFFVNPLILPVQPAVMILGGVAVLVGLVSLPLARPLATLAWVLTAYTIRVVEWAGDFAWGVYLPGAVSLGGVACMYALMFSLTGFQLRTEPGSRRTLPAPLLLAGVILLAVITWRQVLTAPDGRLHVMMLDVDGGDALLIQTPHGRTLLVDGGPSAARLSDALGHWLPPGGRELDGLVLGAAYDQQLAALPLTIERFPPAAVYWAGLPTASRSARLLQEALLEQDIPVIEAEAGMALALGDGAQLRWEAVTRRGSVLQLVWNDFQALFPIGLDLQSLRQLKADHLPGPVSALLLAESGYAPLNPADWLTSLDPQLVLVSVQAGNPDGLPSTETMEHLAGRTILRTDQHGWVHLETDGRRLWVQAAEQGK
jgi:competence protein ComEC